MIDPKFGNVRKVRRSFSEPGHAHELTFTCFRRQPFLSKTRTQKWLIESIDRARETYEFELWAYVIMPEHVHLLINSRRDTYAISDYLKSIKQPVARKATNYLRVHASDAMVRLRAGGTDGFKWYRFWQAGGGYDRNIVNAETAWAVVDYIHANPVRRGLVEKTTDWQLSSAREYAGLDEVLLRVDGCPPDV